MNNSKNDSISVIVPVTERVHNLTELLTTYLDVMGKVGCKFEIICVLDGKYAHLAADIRQAPELENKVKVIGLARNNGESAALMIAVEHAKHDHLLTLPSYEQVESSQIPLLLDYIDQADLVIARRWPRKDSAINRFTSKIFHGVLRWITQASFQDIGCGVRLFNKRVLSEISIYGDQHRFLPILADRRGFKVLEVDLQQSKSDLGVRIYSPKVYVSRLLDLIGVFFLARFTKKPLRFFGMIGSLMGAIGVIILLIAVMQRYIYDIAMADRPILLLGSLCLVLGAQLFALGLVGELIIFTHARDIKEYAIAETVNMEQN